MASGTPWVLKKFQIDHSGMTGLHLNIEARQPGFGAFLLNLMGLDPNASVRVTSGAISMRQSSIKGMDEVTAALTSVGAFLGGYKKPVEYLFGAAFFFCGGLILGVAMGGDGFSIFFGLGTILAVIQFLFYVFNKQMYIGFETAGGAKHTLTFKQAVIEGVSVDIERVEAVIQMVNDLITAAASGKSVNRVIPMSGLGTSGTIHVAQQAEPAHATIPLGAAPEPRPAPASPGTNTPNLRPGPPGPY